MSDEKAPLYLIVIDPSLNLSGWAVFDITAKPKLINYGYIDNHHFPSDQIGNKLIHIEMVMQTLKFAYSPAIVVKEEWVGQSGRYGMRKTAAYTAYSLAGVHNTIAKVFNNHRIFDINNKTFKKGFTGDGNAEKKKVEEYVQKYRTRIWSTRKPLPIRTDDEADAIGLGIYWLILNERVKRVD